jgi:hypothetical protein
MTIRLIVKIQHMRLRKLVCLVFDKVVDGRQVRECLHAKFAVEPAAEGGEDLVFFLGSVPDYILISGLSWLYEEREIRTVPLMHIPDCRVGCGFAVAPGTAWVVEGGW